MPGWRLASLTFPNPVSTTDQHCGVVACKELNIMFGVDRVDAKKALGDDW